MLNENLYVWWFEIELKQQKMKNIAALGFQHTREKNIFHYDIKKELYWMTWKYYKETLYILQTLETD